MLSAFVEGERESLTGSFAQVRPGSLTEVKEYARALATQHPPTLISTVNPNDSSRTPPSLLLNQTRQND